jgi:hypothetical protein
MKRVSTTLTSLVLAGLVLGACGSSTPVATGPRSRGTVEGYATPCLGGFRTPTTPLPTVKIEIRKGGAVVGSSVIHAINSAPFGRQYRYRFEVTPGTYVVANGGLASMQVVVKKDRVSKVNLYSPVCF